MTTFAPGSLQQPHPPQEGVAPPGWETTVKRLKKHRDVSNPWALAWWLRKHGRAAATSEDGSDTQFDADVRQALAMLQHTGGLQSPYVEAGQGMAWAQNACLTGARIIQEQRRW